MQRGQRTTPPSGHNTKTMNARQFSELLKYVIAQNSSGACKNYLFPACYPIQDFSSRRTSPCYHEASMALRCKPALQSDCDSPCIQSATGWSPSACCSSLSGRQR